jgi:type II secretory pathway pseudopilin PulG
MLKHYKAFTLFELLTGLSILGLITALTLPSLFKSLNQNIREATLRDTIKVLNDATRQLSISPPRLASPNNTVWHIYQTILNTKAQSYTSSTSTANAFTLSNGASISHFNRGDTAGLTSGVETILIDADGLTTGFNAIGKDRLMVSVCYNPADNCSAVGNVTANSAQQEAGSTGATPDAGVGSDTGNVAFYRKLTSN